MLSFLIGAIVPLDLLINEIAADLGGLNDKRTANQTLPPSLDPSDNRP